MAFVKIGSLAALPPGSVMEVTLVFLEGQIERGWQIYLEVGRAVQEIKDQKLWKPRYVSFEEYCHAKWKWTLRYANKIIRSAETAYVVGPPYPANAAIAHELAKVVEEDEEKGKAAWKAFHEKNPYPTAKELRKFVRDFLREDNHVTQPFPPANPPNDFTARTLDYLKDMISNFDADRRGRQNFLAQIHSFVQERLYMSHGIYRFKDEDARKAFLNKHHPRPWEDEEEMPPAPVAGV